MVAQNDAPALDLDANNSSGQSGAHLATTFTEDGGPVALADSDATLSDADSTHIQSLTVTITNLLDSSSEVLSADTTGTLISASYNSAAGVLTLTGTDTVANYQQVLRTVTYQNNSDAPDTTDRTIHVVANDGTQDGNTAVATVSMVAVNDAPVLDPLGTPTLTSITEDATSNGGDQVGSFAGAWLSDVDNGTSSGIAVTALDASRGTWQYSTDNGATWSAVGVVSESSALLLRDIDRLRFVPDGLNADTATVTYRAWDQTSGSHGTKVDTTSNGGTTAFSTDQDTASIAVTDVNDAPVLDNSGSPTLTTISEDDTATAGDLIASIVGATISDMDTGPVEGVAVTSLDNGNGAWEYSTNGGTTWLSVGSVSESSALLLRSSDRLRFVPDAMNADTAAVTYRAWDQASGSYGTKVNTTSNGGTTAFSTAQDTASITATAVNDAPVLNTGQQLTLTPVMQDDTTNSGDLVSTIVGSSITDVDLGSVEGIAITSTDEANGTWQYSTDSGATWQDVGAVSDNSARVLTATAQDRLRFVPNAGFWGTVTVGFRAWDTTDSTPTGTPGVDTTSNGGTTTFSSNQQTATLLINDAPVLDNSGAPTLPTITEDETSNSGELVSAIVGGSITDTNVGRNPGLR